MEWGAGLIEHHLRHRLTQLQQDLATGRARLQQLDAQRTQLTETLLRIAGAVQVLEELLHAPLDDPCPEPALDTIQGQAQAEADREVAR